MREIEIQIDFTDITLAETDGVFEDVKKIMSEEPPYVDKWCIRSNITITSPSGIGEMVIQCHEDVKLQIYSWSYLMHHEAQNGQFHMF